MVGVRFNAVCEQLEIRDQIINALILSGLKLNEFTPCNLQFGPDFNNTITLLKHCIYEGFKYNKLTHKCLNTKNHETCHYYTEKGLLVKRVKSLGNYVKLTKQPSNILYNSILVKQDKGSWNIYTADVDKISIMDGFIQ